MDEAANQAIHTASCQGGS